MARSLASRIQFQATPRSATQIGGPSAVWRSILGLERKLCAFTRRTADQGTRMGGANGTNRNEARKYSALSSTAKEKIESYCTHPMWHCQRCRRVAVSPCRRVGGSSSSYRYAAASRSQPARRTPIAQTPTRRPKKKQERQRQQKKIPNSGEHAHDTSSVVRPGSLVQALCQPRRRSFRLAAGGDP